MNAQFKPVVLGWVASWHGGLTSQPGWLNFCNYENLGYNISANSGPFMASLPGRALTVVNWAQLVYVATTNSSSAYWTIELKRIYGTASTVAIARMDTSRLSASAWVLITLSDIGAALASTDWGLQVSVTKTGSPGNLSLGGPQVYVR